MLFQGRNDKLHVLLYTLNFSGSGGGLFSIIYFVNLSNLNILGRGGGLNPRMLMYKTIMIYH